jgi:SNF2 family DNA or RNA helicase
MQTATAVVHRGTGSVLLKVQDPLGLRELLPRSKLLPGDQFNLATQHTLESVKVLRNLGIHVPAPILTDYRWPGRYRPFEHQKAMAEFLTLHRRCFNLSEMGTGKTAAALWAIDWLMESGRVRKALILTPLSTMVRVWQSDCFDVLMHRSVSVIYGTKEKRLAALEKPADIYILNHDGVMISAVTEALRRNPEIDLVVVDEASMFRNHQTKKYKALKKLIRPDQRLWLLTGTPCPNAPTDAWALARLVSPQNVPEYFGVFERMTMVKISTFKWAPRHDAYDIAYKALRPAVRFRKVDCLDLPPVTVRDRQAEMTPEQHKAFLEMRAHMRAEAATTVISAVNAADRINKIRQILCGSIKDPVTGDYIEIPHSGRLSVLKECIEQAAAKVIVVVPFKGIIQALERELSTTWSVGLLNGDVPPKRRDQIIHDFKTQPDPHVLLCHPKVMSHGLNLTEADTLVFYAPIYSNDEYLQVIERFNRAGQTRKMTVLRIGVHPVEWQIYKLVDTKRLTQETILELFKQITA